MELEKLKLKLHILRESWKTATKSQRKVIELQAKAIKLAIEKKKEDTDINIQKQDQQLLKDTQETML